MVVLRIEVEDVDWGDGDKSREVTIYRDNKMVPYQTSFDSTVTLSEIQSAIEAKMADMAITYDTVEVVNI